MPLEIVASRVIYSMDDSHMYSNGLGIDDELSPAIFPTVGARRRYFQMTYFTDFWAVDSNGDNEWEYSEQNGYSMYPNADGAIGSAPGSSYWYISSQQLQSSFTSNSYSHDNANVTSSGSIETNLIFGGLFSNDWQWNSVDEKYFDIPGFLI